MVFSVIFFVVIIYNSVNIDWIFLILPVSADMSSAEDECKDILSAKVLYYNRLLLHVDCFYLRFNTFFRKYS